MKNRFLKSLLAPALLLFHLAAFAEDVDLFVGLPASASNLPNLLLIMDNSANFSASAPNCTYPDGSAPSLNGTTGGVEQCALYAAIQGLEVNADGSAKMNIGLMAFNASGFVDWAGYKCDAVTALGGCLMMPMTAMTAANKATILAWIKTWNAPYTIKTNNKATGAIMQEAWAYYAGRTGISGRSYASIKPPAVCQKNFVVFLGNAYNSSGKAGDQTGDKGPKTALEGGNSVADKNASPAATVAQKAIYLGPVTTVCGTVTFPTSVHENNGDYADEWARYMATPTGTNITTYTIGVHGTGCQAEYAGLLSSMATFGNGKYFPTMSFTELKVALETILSEVQSVNSAFASVSLPASVNTQGTYLNQVYIGMFRPDKDALPRWAGNLKQYKMGMVGNELKLLDAKDESAISSADTGFIAECARSFWTPTDDDTYWTPFPNANCLPHAASSNTPDGNIVEKGAQGYMLRGVTPASRVVKTCSSAACAGLINFDTTQTATITQALLGAADTTERDAIINWTRGLNNKAGDEIFVATTAMRPSVHGDVVHSRPVAVNFGTATAPSVVVFYGGNDGMLRAINGNRTAIYGGVPAGGELWSFVAPESYPIFKRLRDDTTKVSFPGSTSGLPKPYGIDGPIVAYKDATRALIFASMRRGGNALYAFDVTAPASPVLKWRLGSTELANLGQTWSPPKALKTNGYGSGAAPMLIMGGGYDTCEDADPPTCSSTKGNRIYVLDAVTGAKLNEFSTERGVIAEVFVVPDAATGLAKYAYAADLGGNIYRISGADANTPFGNTHPASWTMTKVASLGGGGTDARKFMFSPDVVDDNGTYVLLIGSGDREKPLAITAWANSNAVQNYFFMVKDKPADTTWLTSENATCGDDVICKASLLPILASANPTPAQLATKPKGWYLGMRPKEQVVTSAITVFDTVTFSTHIPPVPASATQCSANLGEAYVYNVKYTNAASTNGTDNRYQDIAGDGLPPSPVAGLVKLDDGKVVPFLFGASPKSPFETKIPTSSELVVQPKGRVYWYIQK